ncbi:response regulator [Belliella kenyensis]|uniref:Response regulator n=1 Tax=Belliella kenyensis TaxID=1472724 RepID=A0ABV8EPY7_9BACT|nr:response regulator transcription factor [Belliella kenyensis]MCH7400822.1 response regulator transcription factor [Belliella kenyensis]MDN3601890.1 response regulator transcription factor [Belliella kenyensis]
MENIRVVLADDHVVVRNGIKMLLESEEEIKVVGEASDGLEALDVVKAENPDILIIDIRMPNMNGLEATSKLHAYSQHTKALVLSMHNDEDYIIKSVESGAAGYLLKDTSKEEFLKAIRLVFNGGKYFSGDISNVLVNSYLNKVNNKNTASGNSKEKNYDLTQREKEILKQIYQGIGNKDIAAASGKSVRTIESHRFNIMKKLKVNNVVELIKKVDEEGDLMRAIGL